MKAIAQLKDMVGKTWLYKTNQVRILSFRHKEESITIVTDKDWVETTVYGLAELLKDFLEVSQEDSPALENTSLQVIANTRNGLSELRSVLMDNIKTLQGNKEFIPQAKAINNNINTMINMVKLEFQITKEMRSK